MHASIPLAFAALLAVPQIAWSNTDADLHRPLHLPTLEAGQPCPVSPVDQRFDWGRAGIFGGSGIGPGPVYPGLGASDPPGHLTTERRSPDSPWSASKLFWYVKPSYRGPVLLRGARLDAPGPVRFSLPLAPRRSPEMRIGRYDREFDSQWHPHGARGRPSGFFIRAPGCYGVQMDGTRFSRVVVFTASTEG